MGLIKVVLFQVLFLATLNLLLAEDSAPPAGGPGGPQGEHSPGPSDPDHDSQNRFFFGFFPLLAGCNYTLQAGRTCATCTQALSCLPNNIGLVRNCRGFFRYCNNGVCSLTQSAACANSTSG